MDAVRASAAFPTGLPPKRIRVAGGFEPTVGMYNERWQQLGFLSADREALSSLYLADGGVWNNLGTDWFSRSTRNRQLTRFEPSRISARSATSWSTRAHRPSEPPRLGMLSLPWLGEAAALVRVLKAMSASTVSSRIEHLAGRDQADARDDCVGAGADRRRCR